MAKFMIFLVNPEHEINELVKEHKTVFEANIMTQIIQVNWQRFLKLWNQESKIQTVLNLWLWCQLRM